MSEQDRAETRGDDNAGAGGGHAVAAIAAVSPGPPRPDELINRELSWLAFNGRVLEEAYNTSHPLLERLRFLSISASNLDEFYMVRVAGLKGLVADGVTSRSPDGLTPAEQLAAINQRVAEVLQAQQRCWHEVTGLLRAQGVEFPDAAELAAEDVDVLRRRFLDEALAVLTPIAVDPAHPFPFIPNRGMGLVVELARPKGEPFIGLVLLPGQLERFIRLPGERLRFIRLEQVIARFIDLLFPGFEARGIGNFRVIRDSDIEVEEEADRLTASQQLVWASLRTALAEAGIEVIGQDEVDAESAAWITNWTTTSKLS